VYENKELDSSGIVVRLDPKREQRWGAHEQGKPFETRDKQDGAPDARNMVTHKVIIVKNNYLAIRMDVAIGTHWGTSQWKEGVCGRSQIRKICGKLKRSGGSWQ